jgi:hypothetical protein
MHGAKYLIQAFEARGDLNKPAPFPKLFRTVKIDQWP